MAAKKKSAKRKPAKKTAARAKKRTGGKKASKRSVSRATAKRASSRSMGSVSVGRKPFSKSQFVATICEHTGLARKDVVCVLESVSCIVNAHVQKSGPEMFSWPGMFKIIVVKKPATKARQGINPFTGESMMFKAKPASRRVKIRALKQLKDMAK
jgi:nucleoid DNA-binding protein